MKIMHVCLNGAVTDGFQYQDNLLPKYHRKLGYDVVLVTSLYAFDEKGIVVKISENRMEYINCDDVRIIRLPMKRGQKYETKLKKYVGLADTLETEKPNIIFIHDFQYPDVAVIKKYLSKHKYIKAYADNHADFSNSATNWISKNILHKIIWRYYAKILEPYIIKFYGVLPARVIFMEKMYGLPKSKCELLVMGADDDLVKKICTQENKKKLRMKWGIDKDDFLIVTGGKIDKWKVQTLLLMDAVKEIGINNVKLIVFGSVDEQIKQEFEQRIDNVKIKYVGWIKPIETYYYFNAAELVIFPGRHSVFWEQTVAEGIPMVVKDWNGTHHIDLGGNVIFLKNDSVDEILYTIEDIVTKPEKYSYMKKIAVEKGMKKFSYLNIAKESIEQR